MNHIENDDLQLLLSEMQREMEWTEAANFNIESENESLLDQVNGLEIENEDLLFERDLYRGALEDIANGDSTSTLEGAIAIAREALEEGGV